MEFKSYQESRSVTLTQTIEGILLNFVYSGTRTSPTSEVSTPTIVRVTGESNIGDGIILRIDRSYNQNGEYSTDANSSGESSLLDLSDLNNGIKEYVLQITQPEE